MSDSRSLFVGSRPFLPSSMFTQHTLRCISIQTSVPKFIQGYNGKPALVTKSGTFTRHENYIEFTINVNMWAFIAKKGLYALVPTFPDFIFNVGFTIEARKDEEMPGQFSSNS